MNRAAGVRPAAKARLAGEGFQTHRERRRTSRRRTTDARSLRQHRREIVLPTRRRRVVADSNRRSKDFQKISRSKCRLNVDQSNNQRERLRSSEGRTSDRCVPRQGFDIPSFCYYAISRFRHRVACAWCGSRCRSAYKPLHDHLHRRHDRHHAK